MSPRRKTNALTPAMFYGARYTQGELAGLESLPPAALNEEISLLRVAIRRAFEQVCTRQPPEDQDWLGALDTLSLACSRLGQVMTSQARCADSGDAWGKTLVLLLRQARAKLHYDDPR